MPRETVKNNICKVMQTQLFTTGGLLGRLSPSPKIRIKNIAIVIRYLLEPAICHLIRIHGLAGI